MSFSSLFMKWSMLFSSSALFYKDVFHVNLQQVIDRNDKNFLRNFAPLRSVVWIGQASGTWRDIR